MTGKVIRYKGLKHLNRAIDESRLLINLEEVRENNSIAYPNDISEL